MSDTGFLFKLRDGGNSNEQMAERNLLHSMEREAAAEILFVVHLVVYVKAWNCYVTLVASLN